MTLFSFVLRFVLCVSLVANGAGTAQASVRMAFEHAAHQSDGQNAAHPAVAAAPCHGHAATDQAATGSDHRSEPAAVATGTAKVETGHRSPGEPDCCKGNACTCSCVQAAACDVISGFVPQAIAVTAAQPPALLAGHAQPRLPHLIRPPIG